MAQFLLSVWHDEDYEVDFSSPEAQRRVAQVGAFNADLHAADALVLAGGLLPASAARVVSPHDAGTEVVVGPYSDSEEHMGGFWIIEADDLDAAIAWAKQGAEACEGPVEVRPLQGG